MFPELLVMLRNRSRSVTSKQAIVPDHNTTSKASQNQNNNHNHNHNQTTAISSVFLTDSSRFFNGVLARSLSDAMTPKSILDHKKFSNFVNNPFLGYTNNMNKNKQTTSTVHHKLDSEAIGLAIIDEINKGNNNICKPKRKIMFFGAKLEVQVPLHDDDISAFTLSKSKSPAEFGIKNRNSRMLSHSGSFEPVRQSKTTDEKLSLTDMELLEDYTCVIIHGQNPKTIHIFDDCIVDSCSCSSVGLPQLKNKHGCGSSPRNSGETHSSFLSICSTCKNKLLESDDIFIYRGDKAFCSDECRCQEMLSQGYEE